MSKRQAQLNDEKRQVSFVQDELLRVRSEQEDERRELSEEGMRLSAMADKADAARVRLKEEEEQITTRRAQLDEEK